MVHAEAHGIAGCVALSNTGQKLRQALPPLPYKSREAALVKSVVAVVPPTVPDDASHCRYQHWHTKSCNERDDTISLAGH